MATHRRGARPSQWPVRDLLGEQRSRMSELWDPRAAAAVAGLLACGAAVTVAFTVSDTVPPDRPEVSTPGPSDAGPSDAGPQALPGPVVAPPAPGPAPGRPVVPALPGPAAGRPVVPSPPLSGSAPRAWRVPAVDPPAAAPARAKRRNRSVQEITDRLATEVAAVQDGRLGGVLVVPIPRGGALRKASTARATGSDDEAGKRKHEHRSDRKHDDDRKRDDEADRDRHREHKGDRDRDRDRKGDDHCECDHRDRGHEDDGHRDRDQEDDGHRSDGHPDSQDHSSRHGHERHETARHDTVPDHAWSAADWFEDDAGRSAVACADPASGQPAMAVLVTRSHDEPGSDLTTHRIDSRALLTVLDDLEADGPSHGCAVPHARGA